MLSDIKKWSRMNRFSLLVGKICSFCDTYWLSQDRRPSALPEADEWDGSEESRPASHILWCLSLWVFTGIIGCFGWNQKRGFSYWESFEEAPLKTIKRIGGQLCHLSPLCLLRWPYIRLGNTYNFHEFCNLLRLKFVFWLSQKNGL